MRVLWDAMPDVSMPSTEHDCVLLPSKWKKDVEMGWRMDVNVDVTNEIDTDNTMETEGNECKSESDSNSGIEYKSGSDSSRDSD